jgi:predicted Zn-dependent peptidase
MTVWNVGAQIAEVLLLGPPIKRHVLNYQNALEALTLADLNRVRTYFAPNAAIVVVGDARFPDD